MVLVEKAAQRHDILIAAHDFLDVATSTAEKRLNALPRVPPEVATQLGSLPVTAASDPEDLKVATVTNTSTANGKLAVWRWARVTVMAGHAATVKAHCRNLGHRQWQGMPR